VQYVLLISHDDAFTPNEQSVEDIRAGQVADLRFVVRRR
jgi:hypothetical protein